MGELLKNIAESVNLPKRAFDNAELLLKKLFGSAVEETGGIIGDAIRSRRFKNQVTIFSKAQELLKDKGIEPKQINLKLLVPLIEYSSLEEDETIQNKWANMIANIATDSNEDSFNKKCISILNELSEREILILDTIFITGIKTSGEYNNKFNQFTKHTLIYRKPDSIDELLPIEKEVDIFIERLTSFGLISKKPQILRKKGKYDNIIRGSTSKDDYYLEDSDKYHLTTFGVYFIKLCKFDK